MQHQYLDDNPSGTPTDDYPIAVTVTDSDGASDTESTTVTVNNVAPVITSLSGDVILENDIAEVISGPFKREKVKVQRVDKQKEEVVVELLEAAVPIPITVRMDAIKVIRRDTDDED